MNNNHNPIIFNKHDDGKTIELNIEGPIGGDYDFWTGEISGVTKEAIKAELKAVGAIKADTIIVNINSYGGDVNHGMSIHDLLAQNPAKKEVRINGMTASAATIIAMAGDTIKISDNALFLPHKSSTIAIGNVNDMQMVIDDLKAIDTLMAKIYSKRTGRTIEDILAQMDVNGGRGEWMTADEAKEFGFVDEIFEPTKMAASFDVKMLAKIGLPEFPTNKTKNQNSDNMKDQKTLVEGIVAAVKAAFSIKEDDKPTVDAINAAAEKEALKLKSEFDVAIKSAVDTVKTEVEAENKKIVDAKELDITNLKADLQKAQDLVIAKGIEIDKLSGKQTPTPASKDASIEGGKPKLSKNDRAAEANAAALRGEEIEEDEEELESAE